MTDRPYLTIVSGLPRSGTSMMMRMLSAGGVTPLVDHVREADVDNPKGYYEFEPVKKTKEDPSWLEEAGGYVVKMVHLLLLDLPLDREYRIVFMHRDLDEVLRSQDKMLQRKGISSHDLPPEKLKRIFRKQLKQVEAHLDEHPECFKKIDVSYNEMLDDAMPHVRRVSDLLDGLDIEAMLGVIDPTLYRNRLATV